MPQFSVTTPATDLTILSVQELRVAAGLAIDDRSKDTTLAQYGKEVAAEIVQDCGVASDGSHTPTLRSEVCADVFRLKCSADALFLSRRHVTAIASIAEDGAAALTATGFRFDAERGKLIRLINDKDACWTASKIEVAYTAGFSSVPDDLKAEAKSRIQIKISEASRDPMARELRKEIPGVLMTQTAYQVGGLGRLDGYGDLSSESLRRLKRFMNFSMIG